MKQQTRLILFLCLLFSTGILYAQEIPVNIRLQTSKKDPVPFASVSAINRLDSTQVKRQVADSNGQVKLQLLKGQQYRIEVMALNYAPFEKNISVGSGTADFRFTLEEKGKTMEGVVLRSSKPLMRQEDDKTIVDPENLVAASSSANPATPSKSTRNGTTSKGSIL